MTLQFTVSDPAEREIRGLRKECTKLRRQRNEARATLAQAQAENERLRAELTELLEASKATTGGRHSAAEFEALR